MHATIELRTQEHIVKVTMPTVKTVDKAPPYHKLGSKFPDVTRLCDIATTKKLVAKHWIGITPGPPIAHKPPRRATECLAAAK